MFRFLFVCPFVCVCVCFHTLITPSMHSLTARNGGVHVLPSPLSFPSSPSLLCTGNQLFKAGQLADAVVAYSRCLQRLSASTTPTADIAAVLCNRSLCYFKLGKWSPSLTDARASMSANPRWMKAYYRAGTALLQLGCVADAVDELSKAVALAPGDGAVRAQLADAQAALASESGLSGARSNLARGTGTLYAWGAPAVAKTVGVPSTTPKVLDALRGRAIEDVGCGLEHVVAVTARGETWAWGANRHGECGCGDGNTAAALPQPQLVPGLVGVPVRAVACGAAHSIVVTRSSQLLYGWGANGQGQLGVGDRLPRTSPVRVPHPATAVVEGVACGLGHTVVLTSDRRVATCGWNTSGQLGLGSSAECVTALTPVPLDCHVAHVACGGGHTVLITANTDGTAEVLTCGASGCGQLGRVAVDGSPIVEWAVEHAEDAIGTPDSPPADQPSFVSAPLPPGSVPLFAACGEEFTCIVTQARDVLSCGLGLAGQQGDGQRNNVRVCNRVLSWVMADAGLYLHPLLPPTFPSSHSGTCSISLKVWMATRCRCCLATGRRLSPSQNPGACSHGAALKTPRRSTWLTATTAPPTASPFPCTH